MANFIDLCISGDALADQIDDFIDLWHDNKAGQDQELHEFLGMTWDEYSVWATNPSILPFILAAHTDNKTLSVELATSIAKLYREAYSIKRKLTDLGIRDNNVSLNLGNQVIPV
jgi:Trp operon repressor